MQNILIKLPENPDDIAEWVVLGNQIQTPPSIRRGSISDAAADIANGRVSVLAPSQDIFMTEAILPEGNRRKLTQALPFMLEDRLASDIEHLHFALGKENKISVKDTPQIAQPVAVIDKQLLENWCSQLESAGIHVQTIVPDALTLPLLEGCWSILIDEQRALVRSNAYAGFACDIENINLLLDQMLTQAANKPQAIYIYASEELREFIQNEHCRYHESIETTTEKTLTNPLESDGENSDFDERIPLHFVLLHDQPLSLLAEGFSKSAHINLLQGAYKVQEKYNAFFKHWRVTASLLVSWLILMFGSAGVELYQLNKQNQQMSTEIKKIFKTILPKGRDNYNIRLQVEQRLALLGGQSASGDSGFIAMLKLASENIKKIGGYKIQAITYTNNQMTIDLSLPTLQSLDQLKASFAQSPSVQAEIQSASSEGGTVKGRLRLSRRP